MILFAYFLVGALLTGWVYRAFGPPSYRSLDNLVLSVLLTLIWPLLALSVVAAWLQGFDE